MSLGYTLQPDPDYNLVHEERNEHNARKADGAILVEGKVVGLIELKDTSTKDIDRDYALFRREISRISAAATLPSIPTAPSA
jgi:hypothetical protein